MADYFDNDLLLAFILTDTRKEKTKLNSYTKRDSTLLFNVYMVDLNNFQLASVTFETE